MREEILKLLESISQTPIAEAYFVSELCSKSFDWPTWREKIPYLEFPSHWQIKVVPPFNAAMVRFFVKTKSMKEEDRISIYLDCYNTLGVSDGPYWEVYPINGETARCRINETTKLIDYIEEGLAFK